VSFRLWLVLGALAAAGCKHPPEPAFERIAVPPFENLTGDPGGDWMGIALAELTVEGMAGAPRSQAFRSDEVADAMLRRATHVLHGYFRLAGGRLHVEATLEDLRKLRMVARCSVTGEPERGPAPLADQVLVALGRRARTVRAPDPEVIRAYAEALSAADSESALEGVLAAAPDFAAPYLVLCRARLARADLAGARAVIARAGRARGFDELDRARVGLMASALAGDIQGRLRQLELLARLSPADGEVFQSLAGLRLARHDYRGAVEAYRQALARDPDNPFLLNEAGYAHAYAGDFSGAVAALERYRRLQPSEPNPADSLGDIYYQFGRFAEAENYYLEAVKKSPASGGGVSSFKAAYARLMRGDLEGADELMRRHLEQRARAGDGLIELRRAQWEYLTGRARQAFKRLVVWADERGRSAEERSLALSLLSVWSLESGQRREARRHAERAVAAARTPLTRLSLFLTEPEASPSDWRRRASETFSELRGEILGQMALAYALLLGKQYRDAVPVLQGLERMAPPAPSEPTAVLTAWALLESGQDPAERLARWPTPEARLLQPSDCLIFPRVIYLRAWWLERQGRRQEAEPLYRLFLRCAAERPGLDGERRRAQAALGR